MIKHIAHLIAKKHPGKTLGLAVFMGLSSIIVLLLGLPMAGQAKAEPHTELRTKLLKRIPLPAPDSISTTQIYTTYLPLMLNDRPLNQWVRLGLANVNVTSIATDPQIPEIIYLGTTDNGVYKSINGGETWQSISDGLPISTTIKHIVIDPLQTNNLFISTNQLSNIYSSENSGESWTARSGLPMPVIGLAINPVTPTTLYAGTMAFELIRGRIYRSNDSGTTWTNISPVDTYYGAQSFIILPGIPQTIYAGGYGKVYKSTDNSESWQELLANAYAIDMAVSPEDENTLYLTGKFVTHNGGASWESMGGGGLPDKDMYRIIVDPIMSQFLYTSFGPSEEDGPCAGVYRSVDEGQTWQPMTTGLDGLCIGDLALTSDGTYLYAAGEAGVWRYTLDHSYTQ